MEDYLKLFKNHSDYEEYKKHAEEMPFICHCIDEAELHIGEEPDPYKGHDYVQIGNLKWATMNIGANSISDRGLYFQWGDNQGYTANEVGSGDGKKYFGWKDYKFGNGTAYPTAADMAKYNSSDGKMVLDAEDDAAVVYWGGLWRMPTINDFLELRDAVTTAWTQVNGVSGFVLTDKNDTEKSIFLPVGGQAGNGSITRATSNLYYWSSSLANTATSALNVNASGGGSVTWGASNARYYGMLIRPVAI